VIGIDKGRFGTVKMKMGEGRWDIIKDMIPSLLEGREEEEKSETHENEKT
jgi:hypothetical protein